MAIEEDIELRELIRKAALLNAASHDGLAQPGAIVGKILGERKDLRTRAKELTGLINSIVAEVNSLGLAEQKAIVERNWPEIQKKEKPEEKKLPQLPNAEKFTQIVTRFSPNPDSVLHLGSARAIILSHEYARMYGGKFILRFEDTDPKIKRPSLAFYDSIRQDLKWLGCKVDEEYIQSDRLPIYYEYTERLIADGNAYVCECMPEEFRKMILAKEACPCRVMSAGENLARWRQMLGGGYAEGQAVVRVKTELEHPNPAVRDWPALRVIDTKKYPHPRVGSKYVVWPLYNLAAGLDDHLMGMTHIIRGKEHYTNMIRQRYMYAYFGWNYPEAIHYGRLKITGAFLSKSKIVQGVKDGTYAGYDDPRLGTFAALRKRGITPEAVKKMIIDVGIKPNDVTLSWENLYAYNRKILDPTTNRYFFVANPVGLKVINVPKTFQAKLPLHPDMPERGFRNYTIVPIGDNEVASFWVSEKDAEQMESGKLIRLMELFNMRITAHGGGLVEATFESEWYDDVRKMKVQLIQWIPKCEQVPCEVVMPDASITKGFAESACKTLKPNDIIQFERFGFVCVNEVGEKLVAYYAQK